MADGFMPCQGCYNRMRTLEREHEEAYDALNDRDSEIDTLRTQLAERDAQLAAQAHETDRARNDSAQLRSSMDWAVMALGQATEPHEFVDVRDHLRSAVSNERLIDWKCFSRRQLELRMADAEQQLAAQAETLRRLRRSYDSRKRFWGKSFLDFSAATASFDNLCDELLPRVGVGE